MNFIHKIRCRVNSNSWDRGISMSYITNRFWSESWAWYGCSVWSKSWNSLEVWGLSTSWFSNKIRSKSWKWNI